MSAEIAVRAFLVSVFVLRGPPGAREVLLMRRVHAPEGAWCQIAGKIEAGETAWQAALRELREETGLVPESFWSADALEMFYEPRRDAMSVAPGFVAFVGAGAEPVLDAEHDAHVWLGFDAAIARVAFSGQRRVLREVAEWFADGLPHPDLRIAT